MPDININGYPFISQSGTNQPQLSSNIDLDAHFNSRRAYFTAYKTSHQTGVTANSDTKIEFGAVEESDTGSFSTTTHGFSVQPDKLGVYIFLVSLSVFSNSNNIGNAIPKLFRSRDGGAETMIAGNYGLVYPSTHRHFTVHLHYITAVQAGDIYYAYGYVDGTSPYFFNGDGQGSRMTCFSGYKIY